MASDSAMQVVRSSLTYGAETGLTGINGDMWFDAIGGSQPTGAFGQSVPTFADGAAASFNPLAQSDEGSLSDLSQLWMDEAMPAPVASLFEGHDAPGHSMMDALLLLGGENAALPGGVDLSAMGLTGGSSEFNLLADGLAQQTVSDALAGQIIDNIIDEFVSAGTSHEPANSVNFEQMLGLLSQDLAGSALASPQIIDTAQVDEAAQLAMIHG
jgi:hypothetical protein